MAAGNGGGASTSHGCASVQLPIAAMHRTENTSTLGRRLVASMYTVLPTEILRSISWVTYTLIDNAVQCRSKEHRSPKDSTVATGKCMQCYFTCRRLCYISPGPS